MKTTQQLVEEIEKINQLPISKEQKDSLINLLFQENGIGASTLQDLKQYLLKEVMIYEPKQKKYQVCTNKYFKLNERRYYGIFKQDENLFVPAYSRWEDNTRKIYNYLCNVFNQNQITNKERISAYLPWDIRKEFIVDGTIGYAIPLVDLIPPKAIYTSIRDEQFITLGTMQDISNKTNDFLARNPNFIEDVFIKRKIK